MLENTHFGSLTPRMQRFRDAVLDQKPYVDAERALLCTEAYERHKNQPPVMKRALMLKNILEKMTIFIEDETLLCGNQAPINKAAPVFPEYTLEFVLRELDTFEKRDGDVFYITEESKAALRSIAPFWENNNLRAKGGALFPEEVSVYMEAGFFGMEGKLNAGDAHLAADYRLVLEKGLKSIEARAKECKAALDLCAAESIDKYVFYNAVLIVIEAVRGFAARYAALARKKAETADEERRKELLKMAEICDRVPYEPARSFHEALQSVWFLQLILQIESNGHSLSFGRFDQYAYPFYRASRAEGMTDAEAEELLTNLWIKTLTVNKVRSQSNTFSAAGSPMYQNVTIGGQTTDRRDAVNPLSFLVLRTVAQTRLPQPNLTVRYHRNLDPAFFDECIEVMKLGFGMPAFNNDEIIVPSFIEKGVTEADALDYAAIGCVETAVPGKWGYRCTGMSYTNFPRTLLCAMNDGIDLTTGKRFAKGQGHFRDMRSFDELMAAWDAVIREITRASVIIENAVDLASEREVPDILCSMLVEDCVGRGKTIKQGGAVYDYISGLQVGVANLTDSLAAIKKLVFDEKRVSPARLWDAMLDNFEGEENAAIREMLIEEAPKYGNDDDNADLLGVRAYETYIDEIRRYPNTRFGRGPIGGVRYSGTSSVSANVGQGYGTMATPDGRKARSPLAEGCSPAHGMDRNGPTAVFKTLSKLPVKEITGGVLLNQKVSPALLSRPENKEKLKLLLKTFFNRLDGYHVQYNVVSRETLLDAQLHPEDHRDLIVRVAGYSAFFNVLSRATQDDIIARTEQTL